VISYPIRHLRPPARPHPPVPCSRHPQLPAASGASYAHDTHGRLRSKGYSRRHRPPAVRLHAPHYRCWQLWGNRQLSQPYAPLYKYSVGALVQGSPIDPRLHTHQQAATDRACALRLRYSHPYLCPQRSSSRGSLTHSLTRSLAAWQASASQQPSRLSASGDADGAGAASNEDMTTHMQRAERRVNAAPSGGGRGWVSGWFGRQVCFRTLKRPVCNCQLCDG
jgi:hypothetical protein